MHRNLKQLAGIIACIAIVPASAACHTGSALQPHNVWSAWTFEPIVVIGLVLASVLYVVGIARLWKKDLGAGIKTWEAAGFAGGLIMAVIALVSPLHALGGVLFSAHMTQHELLISICAPLLIIGRPLIPFLWALPVSWRRGLGELSRGDRLSGTWRILTLPAVAFSLHAIALLIWHLPGPYQSTLNSEVVHSLQHVSFLGTALLFWWTILKRRGSELGYGAAVFYLFATALQTGALGALLTFAPRLWYPAYAATTGPWGLTPLEDQQLGGLIMWIPGSVPYLIAALVIFARWLRSAEIRSVRHDSKVLTAQVVILIAAILALPGCDRASGDTRHLLANSDTERGRTAIRRYGCGSCHDIPGVSGASGMVGPPLGKIAQRVYIAGVLPNEPDNMIRWLENPPRVDPLTAMPYMGVTARDARDITAYLYTLR